MPQSNFGLMRYMNYKNLTRLNSLTAKRQIISKGLLVSSNSPKKRMNKFVFTTTTNLFVRFLGEFEDIKKSFQNYLTSKYENIFLLFFNLKSASLFLQDASRAARIDKTTMPIGLITYMIVLPWSVLFFLNRCYLGNVVIHRHHTTTHDKGSFIYYVSTDLFFYF